MEIHQMRRPDEDNRRPTWFSPEEAKRRLAKGREVKYLHELEAVVDRALERIRFHHELWGAYPSARNTRPAARRKRSHRQCRLAVVGISLRALRGGILRFPRNRQPSTVNWFYETIT